MGLRYASQVDGNQAQIVRELRAMGFRVDLVHRLKKLYDLVVTGTTGNIVNSRDKDIKFKLVASLRVEVKMPGESLTIDEKEYWEAEPFPQTLIVAYSVDDVLKWFGRI